MMPQMVSEYASLQGASHRDRDDSLGRRQLQGLRVTELEKLGVGKENESGIQHAGVERGRVTTRGSE